MVSAYSLCSLIKEIKWIGSSEPGVVEATKVYVRSVGVGVGVPVGVGVGVLVGVGVGVLVGVGVGVAVGVGLGLGLGPMTLSLNTIKG